MRSPTWERGGKNCIVPTRSRRLVYQSGQTETKEYAYNAATNRDSEVKKVETVMSFYETASGESSGHRRILGLCWFVYGIFRLIVGICLVLYSGTATVMFGALLTRVADPFALMGDFHIVYVCIVILTVLCGLFGLLAGLALLANQRPARILAIIAAFLSVSEIPVGTTLGIYTLIVLLPLRGVSPLANSPKRAL
jgi:hypothetical protein